MWNTLSHSRRSIDRLHHQSYHKHDYWQKTVAFILIVCRPNLCFTNGPCPQWSGDMRQLSTEKKHNLSLMHAVIFLYRNLQYPAPSLLQYPFRPSLLAPLLLLRFPRQSRTRERTAGSSADLEIS